MSDASKRQADRLAAWWQRRGWTMVRYTIAALAMSCSGDALTSPGGPPVAPGAIAHTHVTPDTATMVRDSVLGLKTVATSSTGAVVVAGVTYVSRDTNIVKVDGTGTVTAMALGRTRVVATATGIDGSTGSDSLAVTVINRPLAGIVLNNASVKLVAGDSIQMSDTLKDDHGRTLVDTTLKAAWSVADTSVATISASGMLHSKVSGATTVAVAVGKITASASVLVTTPVQVVASVNISKGAFSIAVDSTVTVTATAVDAKGVPIPNAGAVTWSVSNTAIASLASGGTVGGQSAVAFKALATGTTNLQATIGSVSATVAVTVTARPVASVVISPSVASINLGSTATFTVSIKDDLGNAVASTSAGLVTWSTSDTSIVRLANGVALGLKGGTATIKATVANVSGSATVNVIVPGAGPAASINISPLSVTLGVDSTVAFTATVVDGQGKVVTGAPVVWSTDNAGVATVSADGHLLAIGAGTVNLKATSGAISSSVAVTVTARAISNITVAPASVVLAALDSVVLSGVVKDVKNTVVQVPIVWSIDQPTIAVITATGVVHALKAGTATITATAAGKVATVSVTVTATGALASLAIVPPAALSISVDSAVQLVAQAADARGRIIAGVGDTAKWSASGALATVSASGLVHGSALGTGTITATVGSFSASVPITVVAGVGANVTVSPATISVNALDSATVTATVTDSKGDAVSGVVAWSSSNPSVASVVQGKIYGASPGTATITATVNRKTATVAVTVVSTVKTVSITPSVDTVSAGGGGNTLTPSVKDSLGNVVAKSVWASSVAWASSDATVATIDATGHVVGLKAGTTTATVSVLGKTATASIVVLQTVSSVSIAPIADTISTGSGNTLTLTVKDVNGNVLASSVWGGSVVWASSNPSVATVDAMGRVVAVSPGTSVVSVSVMGVMAQGNIIVQSGGAIAIAAPELPRVQVDVSMPITTGKTWYVYPDSTIVVGAGMPNGAGATMAATMAMPDGSDSSAGANTGPASTSAGADSSAGANTGPAVPAVQAAANTAPEAVHATHIGTPIVTPGAIPSTVAKPGAIEKELSTGGDQARWGVGSIEVGGVESVAVGHAAVLGLTVRDGRGSVIAPGNWSAPVRWVSSDPGVIAIDAVGRVIGLRPGVATITVTAMGRGATTRIMVKGGR